MRAKRFKDRDFLETIDTSYMRDCKQRSTGSKRLENHHDMIH